MATASSKELHPGGLCLPYRFGADPAEPCIALCERRAGINIGAVGLDRAIKANECEADLTDARSVIGRGLYIIGNEPEEVIFRRYKLENVWHDGGRVARPAKDCHAKDWPAKDRPAKA
jgi:hypothetical protein